MWGGHEGSLLLWVLLLSAWSALFAWHYRQQTDPLFPLTLAVLSLMLAALLLFVVLWSDPFVRIFPPAIEGRDLNPMLQHPGLSFIHRCFISLRRFDGGGERGAGEFTARRV